MNLKQREKGGVWYVHFTDTCGDLQRLSTKEKDPKLARIRACDIVREHLIEGLDKSERAAVAITVNLSAAFARAYENRWRHQKSRKEKKYLIDALAREVGHWPLPAITKARLADFANLKLREGDSPATVNRKMSAIHTALSEADVQPMPKFPHFAENNVKERYLSTAEEQRVSDWYAGNVARADLEGAYMAALFRLLLETGMRGTEALTLTSANLVGDRLRLLHGSTKANRGRAVPLTSRASAALQLVLASPLHGTWSIDKAGRRWRLTMEKLGMEDVTLHTLRHTCGSRLVQRGVPLAVVRDWLGHSSVTITERYAHLDDSSMDAARAALEGGAEPN